MEVQKFIETLGWEDEADLVKLWKGRDEGESRSPNLLLSERVLITILELPLLYSNSSSASLSLSYSPADDSAFSSHDRIRYLFRSEGGSL